MSDAATAAEQGQASTLIATTISDQYVPKWGIKEALRELIANAKDENAAWGVYWEVSSERAVIWDKGRGLDASAFVLGHGSKVDTGTAIGQFREGLALACVVCARLGVDIAIQSGGFTYTPLLASNPQFGGATTLWLQVYEDAVPITGTLISIQCDLHTLNEAKNLFLRFRQLPELFPGVYMPGADGPAIYVRGLWVASSRLLFTYDLTDQSAIGRDRDLVDWDVVHRFVVDRIENCSSYEYARTVLLKAEETTRMFWPNVELPGWGASPRTQVWRDVFYDLFGADATVCSDMRETRLMLAEVLGLKPVKMEMEWASFLKRAGVRDTDEAINARPLQAPIYAEVTDVSAEIAEAGQRLGKLAAILLEHPVQVSYVSSGRRLPMLQIPPDPTTLPYPLLIPIGVHLTGPGLADAANEIVSAAISSSLYSDAYRRRRIKEGELMLAAMDVVPAWSAPAPENQAGGEADVGDSERPGSGT